MRKTWPASSARAKTRIPSRDLVLGELNEQPFRVSARTRSLQMLYIGAIGTGKTTAMESHIRQDIWAGRSCSVIDPMGALYERLVQFCCYQKAIGCRVPEVLLFNPSAGDWVLPFNPFAAKEGDLSVQVDRRVAATLRAWGQHSGDETPRLEKWLRCLFWVIIKQGLTIIEAEFLIDQRASDVRSLLLRGLTDEFVRRRLDQLATAKPAEFAQQIESVENRLTRFIFSDTLRRVMGGRDDGARLPLHHGSGENPARQPPAQQLPLCGAGAAHRQFADHRVL